MWVPAWFCECSLLVLLQGQTSTRNSHALSAKLVKLEILQLELCEGGNATVWCDCSWSECSLNRSEKAKMKNDSLPGWSLRQPPQCLRHSTLLLCLILRCSSYRSKKAEEEEGKCGSLVDYTYLVSGGSEDLICMCHFAWPAVAVCDCCCCCSWGYHLAIFAASTKFDNF